MLYISSITNYPVEIMEQDILSFLSLENIKCHYEMHKYGIFLMKNIIPEDVQIKILDECIKHAYGLDLLSKDANISYPTRNIFYINITIYVNIINII